VFIALTVEQPETFASGKWQTLTAYARPLFETKLPGLGLGVWDMTLIAAVAVLSLRPATWKNRLPALDLALLASLLAIASWAAYGVVRGGDLRQAEMQLNALARMFVLYFVIHAAFRSSRDTKLLAWIIMAGALYRAVACLVFFWVFARSGVVSPYPQSMTDHHDSALWATAILGLTGWIVASGRWGSLALGGLLGSLLLLAIRYNDRRIAWVEVAGGLVFLYIGMTDGRLRRAIHRYALVCLPLALLYVSAGWTRPERIFGPVQQLKSALTDTSNPSNDARVLENRGLVVTLQNNKILGTGFGHEFIEVSALYSAGMERHFPNYRYLPHNSLLGLLAFTGVAGFAVIWMFVPATAFIAARTFPWARNAAEQALSLVAFAAPFVYSVQAYGDMGIQSLKANVILAASTAIVARLAVNTGAWPSTRRRGAAWRGPAIAPAIGPFSGAESGIAAPPGDADSQEGRFRDAGAGRRIAR
jgi:hypothetical protein